MSKYITSVKPIPSKPLHLRAQELLPPYARDRSEVVALQRHVSILLAEAHLQAQPPQPQVGGCEGAHEAASHSIAPRLLVGTGVLLPAPGHPTAVLYDRLSLIAPFCCSLLVCTVGCLKWL
jgi:hypothetical protein